MSACSSRILTCCHHGRKFTLYCPRHEAVLCALCTGEYQHNRCHLTYLDDNLDQQLYSIVIKKKDDAIDGILSRLQDEFQKIYEIDDFSSENNSGGSERAEIQKRSSLIKDLDKSVNNRVIEIRNLQLSTFRLVLTEIFHKLLSVLEKLLSNFQSTIQGETQKSIQQDIQHFTSLFHDFTVNEFYVETLLTINNTTDKVKLTFSKKILIPKLAKTETASTIGNCFFMPTKQIVFVDVINKQLLIHDKHGLFSHTVALYGQPMDATPCGLNKVVVRYANYNWFEILDISDSSNTKTTMVRRACFRNGVVFSSIDCEHIDIHQHSGALITSVSSESETLFSHIASYKNAFYFIDKKMTTVYKTRTDQKFVQKEKFEDFNKKISITTGRNGFVFVSCGENTLLVLNFDTKLNQKVNLDGAGYDFCICGISLDRQNSKLLVTTDNVSKMGRYAYLYDVEFPDLF